MRVLFLVLVLSVTAYAQVEAPIDPDLITAWKTSVAFAQANLKTKAEILANTKEYKAAKDAEQKLNQLKAQIQQTATKKAPGFILDMDKWTFSKQ